MLVQYGIDASAKKKNEIVDIQWDSNSAINGHCLMVGMSGAGKTYQLKKLIAQMQSSSDSAQGLRVHVFDVHGDIDIENASEVMFSEQSEYGFNPLRINPDKYFGGVRKRVQTFIATMNKVMRKMGTKQEACLRNMLVDIYEAHGFRQNDPNTWHVDERSSQMLSDENKNRVYIDVPIAEKDDAKALGARWSPAPYRCWYVDAHLYQGGITRWSPKMLGRTHPCIGDTLRLARNILQTSFLGTSMEAITNLEIANKAAQAYQKKLFEALKRGNRAFEDEKLELALEKAKIKAIEKYTEYAESVITGKELQDVMKYDSMEVLKSVVDRLENLEAIGVFKPESPPFNPDKSVWRYNIKALTMEERKLFVLFRLEELFLKGVERGEQDFISDVIVLDEGHIYADDDPENIINTISKEARKFGIALICASQQPTHFPDDFVASVGTKIILGIDEMFWRGTATKMRVTDDALKWIKLQKTMLVQIKTKGATKNQWQWTLI